MVAKLLLLFTIVPIIEMAILIPMAHAVGLLPTIALVLTTGLMGAVLAKRQGMAAWRRVSSDLAEGRLPADSLLDGVAVLIAGALLVAPGVLTDITGLLLLVPMFRRPLKSYLRKRFQRSLEANTVNFISFGGPMDGNPFEQASPYDDGEVIDVTPEEPSHVEMGQQHLNS